MQQLFQQAQQAFQSGNLPKADQLFTQLLGIQPFHPDFLHLAGIVKSRMGRHLEAIPLLTRAIERRPHPTYYQNLGLIYAKMSRWDAAIQQYTMALRLAPDFTEALFNVSSALQAVHQYDRAIRNYKKILKKDTRSDRAYFNWALALIQSGRYKSAVPILEKCLKINPSHTRGWQNRGFLHEQWDEWEKAISCYKKCLEQHPRDLKVLKNLMNLYQKTGYHKEACQTGAQLLELDPDNAWLKWQVELLDPIIFESNSEIDTYRNKLLGLLLEIEKSPPPLHPRILEDYSVQPPFILHYLGRDETALRKRMGLLYENYFRKIRGQLSTTKKMNEGEKSRIGFVVTAGHEGVFIKCMSGILNKLSTEKYRLIIICNSPNGQHILQPVFKNKGIEFIQIPKALQEAEQIIRAQSFDILYYWEIGTDCTNYFLPFLGLASYQCTSWGWPMTSGIPGVHYFLSCKLLESDKADQHYSEQLVLFERLPSCYTRPEVPEKMIPLSEFGLPVGKTIYLCVQNIRKIHPDMDQVFREILERDPSGMVVILGESKEMLTERLRDRIYRACVGHEERIFVLPRLDETGYFSMIRHARVVLDTFYYSGGANSVADVFAVAMPYVTLEWEFHRGRYGAAAYRQAKIAEAPVAQDIQEYIELALKMGMNKEYADRISRQMKEAGNAIFDDEYSVVELEGFFDGILGDSQIEIEPQVMAEPRTGSQKIAKQAGAQTDASGVLRKKVAENLKNSNFREAIALLEQILNDHPEDAEANLQLGHVYMKLNDFRKAQSQFENSIRIKPDLLSAHQNLLSIYEMKGDSQKIGETLKMLIQLEPEQSIHRLKKAMYLTLFMESAADLEKSIQLFYQDTDDLIKKKEKWDLDELVQHNWFLLYNMQYYPLDVKPLKEHIAKLFRPSIPKMRIAPKLSGRKKLRLAYLVTAGHENIFIRSMRGIIGQLDRDAFDITIICDLSSELQMKEVHDFKHVDLLLLGNQFQLNVINIYEARFDILHFWEIGTDAMNYFLAHFRMAPVQCSSWGVPATSGLDSIDYHISSIKLEPENAKVHYTEELVLFQHIPTFYYPPVTSDPSFTWKDYSLPEGTRMYLCNQRLQKVQPGFDEIVKGILQNDENAMVVFLEDKQHFLGEMIKKRFKENIPEYADRIYFLSKMPVDKYMGLVQLASVVLDTLEYNGANTWYDAMVCKVPVVSMAGSFQRNRFGYAVCKEMGFLDTVVDGVDEYILKAVKLAQPGRFRDTVVQKIKENRHRLWENKHVISEYEQFYKKAVQKAKQKQK